MKRSQVLVVAVVACLLAASRVSADQATLVADTHTNSAASAANYGKRKQIWVQGPVDGDLVQRGYLLFDLSALPFGTVGSDVARATLTVGVGRVKSSGSFDVFRVVGGGWDEGSLTAGSAPALGATPEASDVAVAPADRSGFKAVDVTALVRDWLDGVLPNNGLALVPNATPLNVALDSKETTSTAHYARLDVTLGAVSSFSGPLNGDVTGGQTATRVTRINGSPLAPLGGVSTGQVLTFLGSGWGPKNVVTSLLAGIGLSLSASDGDVTVSIPTGAITNQLLANPALSVVTGLGLGGGGQVPLGGTLSLVNTGVLSLAALPPLSVSGGQNPSLSLAGLVPLANGGTGAASAAGALANLGGAARGANSDITSLAALTTPLSLVQGGTGASSAATALSNLGAAGRGANSDITSLAALSTPLSLAQGGTGASSAATALSNLGGAARGANSDITALNGLSGVNGNILTLLTSLPVYISQTGALGVVGSSARFKQDVVDMGDATRGLMRLRPVRYRYKPGIDPSGLEQYGLVAEEVAQVYPDLVAYDTEGRPLTVRYQALTPMLLNEIQRQARTIEEQRRRLEQQSAQFEALSARLARIEAQMGAGETINAQRIAAP